MKRIITLFCVLATFSFSFAQSSMKKTAKKQAQEMKIQSVDPTIQPRSVDCIWESDFTDASDWVLDHDSGDCSLDWQIGQNLECQGWYPIDAIDSDDGYYAILDSDFYGGEEGGTETEDSWLTTANPIDCSQYNDVIIEIDTWYQSYSYEKCFIVVSTDGTFPDDLTPETVADPSLGIYEIFPDISGNVQANTGNPFTARVNISESAGGEDEVWVRFNWTGTWGYAWFIDRVCVTQQPAHDIQLSYGVVSHNGTSEEYGRVPTAQIDGEITYSAAVFNFGSEDQTGLDVYMDVLDSENGLELSTAFQNTYDVYYFNFSIS